MIALGLDTAGSWCSAALVDNDQVLASRSDNIGRGHAELLAPMVQAIFTQSGLRPRDLSRIAVCSGPGSFTGLRVALSFAKGLALPYKLPVLGLSSLEVLAHQYDPGHQQTKAIIADVRRAELCWALFNGAELIIAPRTDPIETAKADIQRHAPEALYGDGAAYIDPQSPPAQPLNPALLARLSLGKDPKHYPPQPLYARPPDAKKPAARPG